MLNEFNLRAKKGISPLENYREYLLNRPKSSELNHYFLEEDPNKRLPSTINAIPDSSPIISESIELVAGDLDKGLTQALSTLQFNLRGGLKEIKSEINQLSNLMSWGFSNTVALQEITNQKLEEISELLRIPDQQKMRLYHIQEGLKFLKNALINDDPENEFFELSFKAFHKAIAIEETDYFSHFYLGFINMYSVRQLNPKQAILHLKEAALHAIAEHNFTGDTLSRVDLHLGERIKGYANRYQTIAAQAFLHIGRAYSLLEDYSQSVSYAREASNVIPDFTLSRYEEAKYLIFNGQSQLCIQILEELINDDRYLIIKVAKDLDLLAEAEIKQMLKRLTDYQKGLASNTERQMNELLSESEYSKVTPTYKKWYAKLGEDYLSLRQFNDETLQDRTWGLPNPVVHNRGYYEFLISKNRFRGNVIEAAKMEIKLLEKVSDVKKEVIRKERNRKRITYLFFVVAAFILFLIVRSCFTE